MSSIPRVAMTSITTQIYFFKYLLPRKCVFHIFYLNGLYPSQIEEQYVSDDGAM